MPAGPAFARPPAPRIPESSGPQEGPVIRPPSLPHGAQQTCTHSAPARPRIAWARPCRPARPAKQRTGRVTRRRAAQSGFTRATASPRVIVSAWAAGVTCDTTSCTRPGPPAMGPSRRKPFSLCRVMWSPARHVRCAPRRGGAWGAATCELEWRENKDRRPMMQIADCRCAHKVSKCVAGDIKRSCWFESRTIT